MAYLELTRLLKQIHSLPSTDHTVQVQSRLIQTVFNRIDLHHKPSKDDYLNIIKHHRLLEDSGSIERIFVGMKHKEGFIPSHEMTSNYLQCIHPTLLFRKTIDLIHLFTPSVISSTAYSKLLTILLPIEHINALEIFKIYKSTYFILPIYVWTHMIHHYSSHYTQKSDAYLLLFDEFIQYLVKTAISIDDSSLIAISRMMKDFAADVHYCEKLYQIIKCRVILKVDNQYWSFFVNVFARILARHGMYFRVSQVFDELPDWKCCEKCLESKLIAFNIGSNQACDTQKSQELIDESFIIYQESGYTLNLRIVAQMLQLLIGIPSFSNYSRAITIIETFIGFNNQKDFMNTHDKLLLHLMLSLMNDSEFSQLRLQYQQLIKLNQSLIPVNFQCKLILSVYQSDFDFVKSVLIEMPTILRIKVVFDMISSAKSVKTINRIIFECIDGEMKGYMNWNMIEECKTILEKQDLVTSVAEN